MEKKPVARKVHIMTLISVLAEIYNNQIDFVDMYSELDDNGEDVLGLAYTKDYTEENFLNKENKEESKSKNIIKLSDDDINQLM